MEDEEKEILSKGLINLKAELAEYSRLEAAFGRLLEGNRLKMDSLRLSIIRIERELI